jgi:hypothetical protein
MEIQAGSTLPVASGNPCAIEIYTSLSLSSEVQGGVCRLLSEFSQFLTGIGGLELAVWVLLGRVDRMPRNWIEDWTRWLSSLGVLCLLGVPGMLFPVTKAPSGEEVPAPNPSPVEAPASENNSDNQDQQGLNPNILVVAAKHDQIVSPPGCIG